MESPDLRSRCRMRRSVDWEHTNKEQMTFLEGKRTWVIAELSANHNGALENALELVRAAADAGADAVKIQTYTPETMTLDCEREEFLVRGGTLWDGRKLFDLYREAHLPWDWHGAIFDEAKRVGIPCFSTPFDATAVDFLEQFDPPVHKVASFELTDHPLLAKIASTGRPVILSTGMATAAEIREAVEVLRGGGCPEIVLLKCTSSYPAPAAEANLARIPDMAERFGVVAGLSDHTLGIEVPVAAVALGARVIEKHFCLSRDVPGPDSAFSLEPDEFREMVRAVRVVESAIGEATYERTAAEEKSLAFRRSLFFVRDMEAGETVGSDDVRVIRPGHGLPPKELRQVLGRKLSRAVSLGTPVAWDLLD